MRQHVLSFSFVTILVLVGISSLGSDEPAQTLDVSTAPPPSGSLHDRITIAAAAPGEGDAPPYLADQVMVMPSVGVSLDDVAQALSGEVLREVGRSGYGAIALESGQSPEQAAALLRQAGLVDTVAPMGIIRGAGEPAPGACSTTSGARRLSPYQWHLDAVQAPNVGDVSLSGYTVAVLDTGVAYEFYSDTSGAYAPIPSLTGVTIVAPYDFVNSDAHPNDDHQHGTHIASLIVSQGSVEGVAAGASLMPVKVLDADNAGTELDLIEAIYYATDAGADVINMSLSFAEGYAPSSGLVAALQYAWSAGVVMVGAAGNDGAEYVSWPAASSHVIAVGATRPDGGGGLEPTDYSNLSARVDIMAPGGDITRDADGDGIVDGIVAESIDPLSFKRTGLWMFAGTSQAAALVSGAVTWSLASGESATTVMAALQRGAFNAGWEEVGQFSEGRGAGNLNLAEGLNVSCKGELSALNPIDYYNTALLPWLERLPDGSIQPHARVTVYDALGKPMSGGTGLDTVSVYVTIWGEKGGITSCDLDQLGVCDITWQPSPDDPELVWAFSVDSVVHRGVAHRPGGLIFATDALEILLKAVENAEIEDAMLMWSWEEGWDEGLGEVAAGYSAVDLGTGLASSPLGLAFSESLISGVASADVILNLDGTGLASSPLGEMVVRVYDFDGTGLASSPLGERAFTAMSLGGSGLSGSPLNIQARSVHTDQNIGYDSNLLDFSGEPVPLTGEGGAVVGSSIGSFVDSGGWVGVDGYPLASLLTGTDVIDVTADAVSMYPAGDGSVLLDLGQ